jgi:hypothetical protein
MEELELRNFMRRRVMIGQAYVVEHTCDPRFATLAALLEALDDTKEGTEAEERIELVTVPLETTERLLASVYPIWGELFRLCRGVEVCFGLKDGTVVERQEWCTGLPDLDRIDFERCVISQCILAVVRLNEDGRSNSPELELRDDVIVIDAAVSKDCLDGCKISAAFCKLLRGRRVWRAFDKEISVLHLFENKQSMQRQQSGECLTLTGYSEIEFNNLVDSELELSWTKIRLEDLLDGAPFKLGAGFAELKRLRKIEGKVDWSDWRKTTEPVFLEYLMKQDDLHEIPFAGLAEIHFYAPKCRLVLEKGGSLTLVIDLNGAVRPHLLLNRVLGSLIRCRMIDQLNRVHVESNVAKSFFDSVSRQKRLLLQPMVRDALFDHEPRIARDQLQNSVSSRFRWTLEFAVLRIQLSDPAGLVDVENFLLSNPMLFDVVKELNIFESFHLPAFDLRKDPSLPRCLGMFKFVECIRLNGFLEGHEIPCKTFHRCRFEQRPYLSMKAVQELFPSRRVWTQRYALEGSDLVVFLSDAPFDVDEMEEFLVYYFHLLDIHVKRVVFRGSSASNPVTALPEALCLLRKLQWLYGEFSAQCGLALNLEVLPGQVTLKCFEMFYAKRAQIRKKLATWQKDLHSRVVKRMDPKLWADVSRLLRYVDPVDMAEDLVLHAVGVLVQWIEFRFSEDCSWEEDDVSVMIHSSLQCLWNNGDFSAVWECLTLLFLILSSLDETIGKIDQLRGLIQDWALRQDRFQELDKKEKEKEAELERMLVELKKGQKGKEKSKESRRNVKDSLVYAGSKAKFLLAQKMDSDAKKFLKEEADKVARREAKIAREQAKRTEKLEREVEKKKKQLEEAEAAMEAAAKAAADAAAAAAAAAAALAKKEAPPAMAVEKFSDCVGPCKRKDLGKEMFTSKMWRRKEERVCKECTKEEEGRAQREREEAERAAQQREAEEAAARAEKQRKKKEENEERVRKKLEQEQEQERVEAARVREFLEKKKRDEEEKKRQEEARAAEAERLENERLEKIEQARQEQEAQAALEQQEKILREEVFRRRKEMEMTRKETGKTMQAEQRSTQGPAVVAEVWPLTPVSVSAVVGSPLFLPGEDEDRDGSAARSATRLRDMLGELKLEQYVEQLSKMGCVTVKQFLVLTEEQFEKIGVKKFHLKKLLELQKSIKALKFDDERERYCEQEGMTADLGKLVADYGSAAAQHVRPTMEDEHVAFRLNSSIVFFGVYDGHGGRQVATLCKQKLHGLVRESLVVLAPRKQRPIGSEVSTSGRFEEALRRAFLECDQLVGKELAESQNCGATVGVVLVRKEGGRQLLHVANCGDVRATLCRGVKGVRLSVDHKADTAEERARVEAAGGQARI